MPQNNKTTVKEVRLRRSRPLWCGSVFIGQAIRSRLLWYSSVFIGQAMKIKAAMMQHYGRESTQIVGVSYRMEVSIVWFVFGCFHCLFWIGTSYNMYVPLFICYILRHGLFHCLFGTSCNTDASMLIGRLRKVNKGPESCWVSIQNALQCTGYMTFFYCTSEAN